MPTPTTQTELLKTQEEELIKSYSVYDVTDRPTTIYTAAANAINGAPCTKVDYEYRDPASQQILKMRESYSTWNSAWDIT